MTLSSRNNKNITEYIRKTLNVYRFGEPFETLLVETFVRMQYVLELSPNELREDINNFANSVYQFRFDTMDPNTLGYNSPSRREIVFNYDYWQDKMNRYSEEEYTIMFFETFAHEVIHGMQNVPDKDGVLYNRAGGFNTKTNNRSHAIYEICTQATAAKIARNRNLQQYDQGQILAGDGYSDEIFAVPLIASSFGVSEQEVLKYGLRERSKLVKALDKHIGNEQYTKSILKQIEDELELIHSITYPDDSQTKYKNMPEIEKSKLKTQSILKLTNLCQSVFAKRIASVPLDIDKKTITALKSDQKKMLDTLRNEFTYYGYGLDGDYNRMFFMTTDFSMEARYIKKALNVLSDIGKDKDGRFSTNRLYIVDCVKRGDFDALERYGIENEREATMYLVSHDVGLNEKKIHKDYNSLIDWNNKDIRDVIYGRILDTDKIPVVMNLKNWDERRLESFEGVRKLKVLQNAATQTAKKHDGKDIRYLLFKIIESDPEEIASYYSGITRDGNARDEFTKEFSTLEDKEYLLKLMAKKYLERIFDFNSRVPKTIRNETEAEKQIRESLLPTLQKYGKEHTMWAITKTVLEGNYDSISNDGRGIRENLQLVSPKTFLDTISKPFMDELMQKREVPENIKNAVEYSILRTEGKYPGSIGNRIARFVDGFNNTGRFDYNHFTTDGRNGMTNNITNREDLEMMIGYICDNFTTIALEEQNVRNGNNSANRYYRDLAVQLGPDSFREAMIRAIMDRDYSGFSPADANYFSTINNSTLLGNIMGPTVEKVFQKQRIYDSRMPRYNAPVTVTDLRQNARKQKLSIIDKFLIKLKGIFNRNKQNNNEYER